MGSNKPERQITGSRNRIRLKVLLPVVLLPVLAVLLFVALRLNGHAPATQPTEPQPQTAAASNASTPAPAHPITHSYSPPPTSPSETEPETARLTSIMLDNAASLRQRRQAARSLAKIGTDEAMVQLKAALTNNSPSFVKTAIAEALGQSPNAEARDLLHELVNGRDQTVARAAVRGLASRGDADAVQTLGNLLYSDQTPLGLRTESALSLGDVDLPDAQNLLIKAATQIQDDDVVESVLDGLGRRQFSETQDFFRGYLDSPNVSPDLKVLAIEAITDSDGDVAPFLAKYLNDPNPDVRDAAKSALDFLGPPPENATK